MKKGFLFIALAMTVCSGFAQNGRTIRKGDEEVNDEYRGGISAKTVMLVPEDSLDHVLPGIPVERRIRFNPALQRYEGGIGTEWTPLGGGGEPQGLQETVENGGVYQSGTGIRFALGADGQDFQITKPAVNGGTAYQYVNNNLELSGEGVEQSTRVVSSIQNTAVNSLGVQSSSVLGVIAGLNPDGSAYSVWELIGSKDDSGETTSIRYYHDPSVESVDNSNGIEITDGVYNKGLVAKTEFPITEPLQYVYKKYVDDAITAGGGGSDTAQNVYGRGSEVILESSDSSTPKQIDHYVKNVFSFNKTAGTSVFNNGQLFSAEGNVYLTNDSGVIAAHSLAIGANITPADPYTFFRASLTDINNNILGINYNTVGTTRLTKGIEITDEIDETGITFKEDYSDNQVLDPKAATSTLAVKKLIAEAGLQGVLFSNPTAISQDEESSFTIQPLLGGSEEFPYVDFKSSGNLGGGRVTTQLGLDWNRFKIRKFKADGSEKVFDMEDENVHLHSYASDGSGSVLNLNDTGFGIGYTHSNSGTTTLSTRNPQTGISTGIFLPAAATSINYTLPVDVNGKTAGNDGKLVLTPGDIGAAEDTIVVKKSGESSQSIAGTLILGSGGVSITSGGKMNTNQDIEVVGSTKGFILESPDGTRYKLTVANGGTVTTTAMP
ncbi:hypothetical protein [Flavobacterium cerinum]|uniref:Uncharacterized protein n=1 Tax=Flavobacterium cerinum TaxID=2502784 RepID=A0A3S3R0Q7_9FLAO|nr:hypothetical protein [Flavobacterium cerinum]RWX00902.1 hypothetical protein EPI11_07730 [Flavobacterium cerinum]